LRDIAPAAFLHFGFDHLAANSMPLLILGFLVAMSGLRRFVAVVTVIILTSGLKVCHIIRHILDGRSSGPKMVLSGMPTFNSARFPMFLTAVGRGSSRDGAGIDPKRALPTRSRRTSPVVRRRC
jgi:hypothetical protein